MFWMRKIFITTTENFSYYDRKFSLQCGNFFIAMTDLRNCSRSFPALQPHLILTFINNPFIYICNYEHDI